MHNSALSKKKRYKDGITVMQLRIYALNSENIFRINPKRNNLWTCFFVTCLNDQEWYTTTWYLTNQLF